MNSPGIEVRPLLNYYGRHHFNEVFFDNVKVPAENLVGEEHRGWYHLMQALAYERRSLAPSMTGQLRRLLERLVEYTKTTKHDGRPLCENPIIRHKLAEMAVQMEVLKLFAYQFTWRLNQGAIPTYESSRNKIASEEVFKLIAFNGAEILGAYSQIDPDSELARLQGKIQGTYLGFPGNLIAAGTTEVEKSIIAQFALGLPKSY
jgi:hypothetical protein